MARSTRSSRRIAAGAIGGVVLLVSVGLWPTSDRRVIGGAARPLGVPAEPGVRSPRYLIMSAQVRPVNVAERLLGWTGHEAAGLSPGSMEASKQDAWEASLRELGTTFKLAGVLPGSPAARADLIDGDVLAGVDGGLFSLQQVNDDLRAGRAARLRILRHGRPVDLNLSGEPSLFGAPGDPGVGGVVLSAQSSSTTPPPLDTGSVQGVSAGLLLALADVDLLTPGSLTGGLVVAATGAIDRYGNVIGVSAYAEKTAAAVRAGADVFLVPQADVEVIKAYAPESLTVIGVDTLHAAVEALCEMGGQSSTCPTGTGPGA